MLKQFFTSKQFLHGVIAVAVFAIISVVYFSPDVFEGNVLRQHDMQQGAAIGEEVRQFTAETGETSRWTNSLFGGMPNFQISPSYESTAWFSWIGKVLGLGLPNPANLLMIMMLGFFILLIAFDVRWDLAIMGAIAWTFSTYFIIIIGAGHIWKFATLMYIPPTIAGVVWAYRGRYLLGGVVAALFATLQLASNHVQMTYYFCFLIFALVIGYLIKALMEKRAMEWVKATGMLVVAATLAVLANSPNLYHTYAYGKETMRGGHSEIVKASDDANASKGGLDKSYITQWSYGIDEMATFIVPNAKGGASIKPEKGDNLPLFITNTPEAQSMLNNGELDSQTASYLGQFLQYFGDQPMTNGPVYVGALIFALFILGCIIVKGPVKWSILVMTLLTVMLAWGHNFMGLTDWFIDHFPMYSKFRTVASFLVVAEFTIPLLAILGVQKLLESEKPQEEYFKPICISFGVTFFFCLLLAFVPQVMGDGITAEEFNAYRQYLDDPQYAPTVNLILAKASEIRHSMVSADAWRSFVFVALGFCVMFAYMKKWFKPTHVVIALTLIVFADLYSVNRRYLNHDSFATPYANADKAFEPRAVDTEILKDTTMNYRVLDLDHFSEAMPSYFHKTIGGYHAAKLSRYQDVLTYQFERGVNMDVVNMLNGKYIIYQNQVSINDDALGNAWFVDTLDFVNNANEEMAALTTLHPANRAVADAKFKSALDDAISPKQLGDTIFETTYAPNRLTYSSNSANGGLAVFSEVYFPWGWNASIDGKPVEIGRVNYILRAIRVPAGKHTIEFEFKPESVSITETLAFVAIALMYIGAIALIVMSLRKSKHTK